MDTYQFMYIMAVKKNLTTIEIYFSKFEWMHNKTRKILSTDRAGKLMYLSQKYGLSKGKISLMSGRNRLCFLASTDNSGRTGLAGPTEGTNPTLSYTDLKSLHQRVGIVYGVLHLLHLLVPFGSTPRTSGRLRIALTCLHPTCKIKITSNMQKLSSAVAPLKKKKQFPWIVSRNFKYPIWYIPGCV